MKDRKMSFYNRIVKRMLDIICSLAAIVCLSVLYLPICAIIKCTSEGPVFFRQKRIGKNKKYFNILKFRTMRIDTPKDCPTHLLKNPEQYITKVGAFLRKTSLDELPQIQVLTNCLKFLIFLRAICRLSVQDLHFGIRMI